MVFPVVGQGGGVQGVAGPPGLLRAQGAADVFLALLAALLSESQWPTDAQHVVGDEDSASVRAPVQDKREVEGETPVLAGALAVLGAAPAWPAAVSGQQVEPGVVVPHGTESEVARGVPGVGQVTAQQGVMLSVPKGADLLSKTSSPEPAGEQLLSKASTAGLTAVGRGQPQVQAQRSQASAHEDLLISDLTAVQSTLAPDAPDAGAGVSAAQLDHGGQVGSRAPVTRFQGVVPREIDGGVQGVAVGQQVPTKGLPSAIVRGVANGESVTTAEHAGIAVKSTARRDHGHGAAEGAELVGSLSPMRGGVEQATVEPGGWVEPIAQVEEQVLQALERGVRQVRVRLEPPELGVVDVRVREIGGRLEVTLAAEHPEVRQALEHGRNGLRMALAAGGFNVQRLEIQPLTGSSRQDLLGGAPGGNGWGGGQQGTAGDPGWARENAMVSHLPPREVAEQERRRSFQPASLVDTWA